MVVVRKICRCSDLSLKFCKSTLKSQALPLHMKILHNVLQHVISLKYRHGDAITYLDVYILDSILEGRVLNVGNIIVQHMLSTLCIGKRSLPFGSIITQILKHFLGHITEPLSFALRN